MAGSVRFGRDRQGRSCTRGAGNHRSNSSGCGVLRRRRDGGDDAGSYRLRHRAKWRRRRPTHRDPRCVVPRDRAEGSGDHGTCGSAPRCSWRGPGGAHPRTRGQWSCLTARDSHATAAHPCRISDARNPDRGVRRRPLRRPRRLGVEAMACSRRVRRCASLDGPEPAHARHRAIYGAARDGVDGDPCRGRSVLSPNRGPR